MGLMDVIGMGMRCVEMGFRMAGMGMRCVEMGFRMLGMGMM